MRFNQRSSARHPRGGRLQIGIGGRLGSEQVADFKSESVAGFKSEWVADFPRNPHLSSTQTHADARDPVPSAPLAHGPQAKTCSLSCLSSLHLLKSWSLRQTRGGSGTTALARTV